MKAPIYHLQCKNLHVWNLILQTWLPAGWACPCMGEHPGTLRGAPKHLQKPTLEDPRLFSCLQGGSSAWNVSLLSQARRTLLLGWALLPGFLPLFQALASFPHFTAPSSSFILGARAANPLTVACPLGKPPSYQMDSFQQLRYPEATRIFKVLTSIHVLTLARQDGP